MTRWLVEDTRPRATPEQIRNFVERYGDSALRHAAELIPIMQRDEADESRITVSDVALTEDLRMTYRLRAEHLQNGPVGPRYPPGLAHDVRAFSEQLDTARDQRARWWSVDLPSGIAYLFLELVDDRRIAGAIKSADQRVAAATSS